MTVHDVQTVRAFEHPGAGRKRAKATPKGRQVDPTAAHEIELLLGDRPRRRDLLIEHLHLIQDKYHQISAAHLAALADEARQPLSGVPHGMRSAISLPNRTLSEIPRSSG